jgi:RsiW-degrading membrane proteinase PrsW (M82 family)
VILGYTIVLIGVATLVGLLDTGLGLAGRKPADVSIIGVAAIEVLLIAQIVIAIVAPAVGNAPTGNALEFWVYLVTAAIIPPLAVLWALLERTRWSTVVLGVAGLAVAVMVYRMEQIWTIQLA